MPVSTLSPYADYACAHSGACCTAGWAIPVDAPLHRTLDEALRDGRLPAGHDPFVPADDLPHGEPVVLRQSNGACVFFDAGAGRLCRIQSRLGRDALPSACRHFPRVVVLDPRGVHVTFSHFCPTAARCLWHPGPTIVVNEARSCPAHDRWEGLDARDALPPLLRPGLLMDWEGWAACERAAVSILGDADTPEAGLRRLRAMVEALETWTPGDGPLAARVDTAAECAADDGREPDADELVRLDGVARAAVPEDLAAPQPPATLRREPGRLSPFQGPLRLPVCRFLAAHAYASWTVHHARRLLTWVWSVETAYAVLRVECARAVTDAGRDLDEALLIDAVRETDRLLVHLVPARALSEGLTREAGLRSGLEREFR